MILLGILAVFITLTANKITGEWVEIPQFSDESKVFSKLPWNKRERFDVKSSPADYEIVRRPSSDDLRNISKLLGEPGGFAVDDDKGRLTQMETPPNMEVPPSLILTPLTPSSSTANLSDEGRPNERSEKEESFVFLPIDMLERVHCTLKSQPSTREGKIQFLKRFERTLMTEIESRLSTAVVPARRTRGIDYHDEEGIAFPSLEGALMAISFLTFAVYLVRLIMMLFQNVNGTAATTSATTVFLGRKKRSVGPSVMDETARIVGYLDAYSPYH